MDQSQISEWKQQYGDIFEVEFRTKEYIFRALTFKEYEQIAKKDLNAAEQEDELVKTAILYPYGPEFDRIPAGIVTSLAQRVLECSGITNVDTAQDMLDAGRKESQSVKGMMYAFVLAAFPSITLQELDEFTFSQLCYRVALAEQVLEIRQASNAAENKVTFQLDDSTEKKAPAKKTKGRADPAVDPIARKLETALAHNRPYTPGDPEAS